MKKRTVFFQVAAFLAGFLLLFIWITDVFQPKLLFKSEYVSPETEVWSDFYQQDKNSLDVLYVGSSHVYNAINPIVIYENAGYTGVDLASSAQDMGTSYFYIKEALRYQQPECIILDAYGFVWESFSLEENYKRSLDNMRWSEVKLEAVRTWQQYHEEELLTRIFTILDYHSRWGELVEYDFSYRSDMVLMRGFAPTFESAAVSHIPFNAEVGLEVTDRSREYFNEIVELCDENEIQLILISTPACDWTTVQSDVVQKLADEYQVEYWDFNRSDEYESIGIYDMTDYKDRNHLNVYGAEKFSAVLADRLCEAEVIDAEHSQAAVQEWNAAVEEWRSYKASEEQKIAEQ